MAICGGRLEVTSPVKLQLQESTYGVTACRAPSTESLHSVVQLAVHGCRGSAEAITRSPVQSAPLGRRTRHPAAGWSYMLML